MSKFVNQVGVPAAPAFLEVVVKGTLSVPAEGDVPAVTVFNFRRTNTDNPVDVTDIATVFGGQWNTAISPATVDEYVYNQFVARTMDDPTSGIGIFDDADGGTNPGDPYQTDTAVYFQFRTGFRGRSFFGSKHIGGHAESSVDAGYLNAAGVTLWTVMKTMFELWSTTGLVDSNGNAWKLIVLSRLLSTLGIDTIPNVFTGAEVKTVLLNKRIGTMGKRRGIRDAIA